MKTITCVLIFHLIFQNSLAKSAIQGQNLVYLFKSSLNAFTAASDESLSRWTLLGQLQVQNFQDHVTFQFHDLKTSLYNGLTSNINLAHKKEIPQEAKIIEQPFVIHYKNGLSVNISVLPDEPLWSLHMKMAIGNIFQLDDNGIKQEESSVQEKLIHGNCRVAYQKLGSEQDKIITKAIDLTKCEESFFKYRSNKKSIFIAPDFEPYHAHIFRTYKIAQGVANHIESSYSFSHASMPDDNLTLSVEQIQIFNLQSSEVITDLIDTSKNTVTKDILFEFGEDFSGGRHPIDTNTANLVKKFIDNYEMFDKKFTEYPLGNRDLKAGDKLENMFYALLDLKEGGPQALQKAVFDYSHHNLNETFLSFLPYIGTDYTAKLIKEIAEDRNLYTNIFDVIRLLIKFPTYVLSPTKQLLHSMKGLMNLEDVEHKMVHNTGILSFSNLVAYSNDKELLSDSAFQEYKDDFFKKYSDAEGHENKMIYLLGLVNLGDKLNYDFMLSIILHTHCRHLRSLAIYGFKKQLTLEPEKVFQDFWPIVQNKSEPLEIRVASLDVLLSSSLSKDNFHKMIEVYKKNYDDLVDQYLSNYFYTTLQSIENVTRLQDPLTELATAALYEHKFPYYYHAWMTGNYRMSFTDTTPNLGASFQAHFVADPKTNMINVARFTYKEFALSLDMGTYTFYIKFEGLPQAYFAYLNKRPTGSAVLEILEKLKANDFHLKTANNFHIEFVAFLNNRAVFAFYINKETGPTYNWVFGRDRGIECLLKDYRLISFPLMDYTSSVSDIGTPIRLTQDMDNILSFTLEPQFPKYNIKKRSFWSLQTWLESYNPIVDTSVASYKYTGFKHHVKLNVKLEDTPGNPSRKISWVNEKDMFAQTEDRLTGTAVMDEEVLKKYCDECEHVEDYVTELIDFTGNNFMQKFGMDYNNTEIIDPEYMVTQLNSPVNVSGHLSNTFTTPYAGTILRIAHFCLFKTYFMMEQTKKSVISKPYFDEPYETILDASGFIYYYEILNHPFNNFTINATLGFTAIKLEDASVLGHTDIFYEFKRSCNPNVTLSLGVRFSENMRKDEALKNESYRICYDVNMHFPELRSDKLSLERIEPVTCIIQFKQGTVGADEPDDICPDLVFVAKEIIFKNEENMKNIENTMPEYKTCKEQQSNQKYVPASEECIAAHHKMSQYDHIDMKADFHDSVIVNRLSELNLPTKNVTLLTGERADNYKFIMKLSEIVGAFIETRSEINMTSTFIDRMIADPSAVAYGDSDVYSGLSGICLITPENVRTFSGASVSISDEKSEENLIALIDCVETPYYSLTFKKKNGKITEFTYLSPNSTLTASVEGNKIKIVLDGQEITSSHGDHEVFDIHYLEDDIVYVIGHSVQIYFNTEYMYAKSSYLYSYFTCGLCNTSQKK